MLTRWSNFGLGDFERSFSALSELRREMDRVLEDFDRYAVPGEVTRAVWPRVSLSDNGQQLELRAELPGFSDKDIHITVEQGSLTIRGERKPEAPEGYSVHRQERSAMRFARSFTLPSPVDTAKVEATLSNGILLLKMPKAEEARPREIQITAG
jgi:HSP20 family protein